MMTQVKCDYCGNYINDYDERCPYCGASNQSLKRTVKETPTTIEELKDWYQARNLPPEEVTRFFIGKNIKEKRAFGIYEHQGLYTVYKNKDDGTRAIRYEGKDEAYAVNELYLRLKQEILNQKNHQQHTKSHSKKRKKGLWPIYILFISFAITIVTPFAAFFHWYRQDQKSPQAYSYYLAETFNGKHSSYDIYYYYGSTYKDGQRSYEWWKYNFALDDWKCYANYENNEFPDQITYTDKTDLWDIEEKTHLTYEQLSIYNSHNYIDAGHHYQPSSEAYYYYDNHLYYYLSDDYGERYGTRDNTGWYIYNDGWQYYCDYDDRDLLGDDLWYDDQKYYIGSSFGDDVYYITPEEAIEWDSYTTFEETPYYQEMVDATNAFNEYYEENHKESSSHSSWDNDSSWDWSSSDSWDSGSTDWSSDW